jgi:hypothetical protein
VKAYGKIPGRTKTGLKLAHGKSKDHRPDLMQTVFSLSVSSDGAVPVHYKTYSGNRTDDTTHIERASLLGYRRERVNNHDSAADRHDIREQVYHQRIVSRCRKAVNFTLFSI